MLVGKITHHKMFSWCTIHFNRKSYGLELGAINQSRFKGGGRDDVFFILPSSRSRPKEVSEVPKISS